jgi:hypothetical protein
VLYYEADPRDGGQGTGCNTCCCQTLSLRPGETNLVTINYAPWSLPIAPPGIVPTMEFAITHDQSACPTTAIDGFLPPTNTNQTLTTAAGAPLVVDLGANAAPAGNTFSYEIVPMNGPLKGTFTATGAPGSGQFTYTPNPGQTGFDYVTYRMIDAQGREVVRTVQVSIGVHSDRADLSRLSLVPFIDPSKVKTNGHNQTVSFPIYMPMTCRPCDEYRLTIRQPARDCERNEYNHLSCYDIRCKDCG